MSTLREQVLEKFVDIEGQDAIFTDSQMSSYVLDNCEIIFKPGIRFFPLLDVTEANCVAYYMMQARFAKEFAPFADETYLAATGTEALEMGFDFGHTSPNWSNVLKLGFVGLKKQAEEYAKKGGTSEQKRFYEGVLRVYEASERFANRVIVAAEKEGKTEIAESLKHLLVATPSNLFEAIQLILFYYTLQHRAEATWIRTFGRIDQLLYPFYEKEDKEVARQMIYDFINDLQIQNESANEPFALGGTDKDGNCLINELSYVFMEEYIKQKHPWVKIHVLCADDMPEDFLKLCLDGVRQGANSVLFMGDTTLKNSLRRLGIAEDDIVDYHVDGCYEVGGYGELTSPATGRVSLAKAVEFALNNGCDMTTGQLVGLPVEKEPATFEEFYNEYLRQLGKICDLAKDYIGKMESLYPKLHAGLLFTSTYPECMERGKDIFVHFGAKYNDTAINAVGLGTAVDSLMAVKKLVFDDKKMTLSELSDLMKNNWEGQEALRLAAKNKFPKYGIADPVVDGYANDIVEKLDDFINKQPNAKGGMYRLGLLSIIWRWWMGSKLAATPDGRFFGESTSLNSSASFGADREGVTAHILSMTSVDSTYAPNGVPLDIDMHASAVKGENGLNVLYATLKTFLDNGGFAVHYNVLDAEVLKDAQRKPEDYPNLQVRICGWNSLFNQLSKEAQDEYIMRAERE